MAWNDILNGELWGKIRTQINSPGIGPEGDLAIQPGREYDQADWAAGVETVEGLIAPLDLRELQTGRSMVQAFAQWRNPSGSILQGDNFNIQSITRSGNVYTVTFSQAIDRAGYQIIGSCNYSSGTDDSNQGNLHCNAISQTQCEILWVGGGGSGNYFLDYCSIMVI